MRAWPVQEAKAKFSEMLDDCVRSGPQVVTRRGVETAVLVPIAEWRRVEEGRRLTFKELLLTDYARGELPIPPRGTLRRRASSKF